MCLVATKETLTRGGGGTDSLVLNNVSYGMVEARCPSDG